MHRTIINEIAQKAGLDENETGDFAFCEKIALEGTKAVAELLDAQTKENGGLIGDPGNYMSYCNDGFGHFVGDRASCRWGEQLCGICEKIIFLSRFIWSGAAESM